MRLFLDSSVLIAASGSATGASRFIVEASFVRGWTLLAALYCVEEARRNIPKLGASGSRYLSELVMPVLEIVSTEVSLDRVLVFPKSKDRPVLISAIGAEADYLLTLDKSDFQTRLGRQFYGMKIRSPGLFLREQRERM